MQTVEDQTSDHVRYRVVVRGLRGVKMADRDAVQAKAQDEAFRAYVREAAHGNENGTGTADELTRLADLRDHGVISEADFQRGKDKVLSRPAA